MSIKVIGAGTGRTGTVSLKLALEHLGFGPTYHMYELFENPERNVFWKEAIKKRTTDWDKLLSGYHSIVDYPGCEFYRELYDHFPGSKVILTHRDPEGWYESARSTIYTATPNVVQKLKILGKLPFNAKLRRLMPVFPLIDHLWDKVFEGRFEDKNYAIRRFVELEEKVIASIPREDLLVFNLGDGWGPLCDFLDVPVPDMPYPKANERAKFHRNLNMIRNGEVPPVD
jgi:Sulfotransferase domain